MRIALFASLALALAAPAPCQQPQLLRVRVASSSGRSVFLDEGRASGLAPGTQVRLLPPGQPPIDGVVAAVTANSARVDLAPGQPVPPAGTPAEARVAAPAEPRSPAPASPAAPAHPPWARAEEPRTEEMPLLAPAFGERPDERPVDVHGRVFSQVDYNRDTGASRDNDYYLARLATRLEATNLLGHGGLLRFAGEVNRRGADLVDEGDATQTRGRIDWLSYALGGEDYRSYRVELGRFQSSYVPEIGLIDGIEGAVQWEGGLRTGVGVGAYPVPFPDRTPIEDYSLHVFADWQSPGPDGLAAAIAYQTTWHQGTHDRDLLLGRINVSPTETLSVYGLAKVDFYSASDTLKDASVQITEAWAQLRWLPSDEGGAAVSYSLYRWPELLREEYRNLEPRFVADGRVDRLELSGWHALGAGVRLDGRLNYWDDQDADGVGGELRAGWDDVLASGVLLSTAFYYADGALSGGPGWRLDARRAFGPVFAWIGYDWSRYSTRDLLGGNATFERQSLRAGADALFGDWTVNLATYVNSGDGENALGVSLQAVYSF